MSLVGLPASGDADKKSLTVADPAAGMIKLSKKDFCERWISTTDQEGEELDIVLLLTPTAQFYKRDNEKGTFTSWKILTRF